nr:ISL3 family transposase [Ktedonosporobacter rubrisoli]
MEIAQFFPLGEGLELTQIERQADQFVLHVTATSPTAVCPLCQQPATHLHSRYRCVVKDLPCVGQQVRLILHVRKFFCETADCVRKVFAERLPQLVALLAQMTTRLSEALQTIGMATCGKLGARLVMHLGITTSWMTIVRRIMALPTPQAEHVECLGLDDFSFLRGRTFGTVVVDLEAHQIIDLLPDRQADTAAAWMTAHPEIKYVSRDRGAEYASAASTGAPQAIQVADRFHVSKHLSEAVQKLLARVLSKLKTASQEADGKAPAQEDTFAPVEEWRPDPRVQVARTIASRRDERDARYQQAVRLRGQGLAIKEIACQLGASERTVRHWFERGVAPDTRPRRKQQSGFDPYAPYVLKRWRDGERNGTRLWEEIAAQGYPGSQRMVYRFLKTLKKTEVKPPGETPQVVYSTSAVAVCLFMRHPDNLAEGERMDLAALRRVHPDLESAYCLTQDFLQMLRKREGERLDTWLTKVQESEIPELQSFAHGVDQDKAAVQAG